MIAPARTGVPECTFTPRRCAAESRPFREDAAPFFFDIVYSRSRRYAPGRLGPGSLRRRISARLVDSAGFVSTGFRRRSHRNPAPRSLTSGLRLLRGLYPWRDLRDLEQ